MDRVDSWFELRRSKKSKICPGVTETVDRRATAALKPVTPQLEQETIADPPGVVAASSQDQSPAVKAFTPAAAPPTSSDPPVQQPATASPAPHPSSRPSLIAALHTEVTRAEAVLRRGGLVPMASPSAGATAGGLDRSLVRKAYCFVGHTCTSAC